MPRTRTARAFLLATAVSAGVLAVFGRGLPFPFVYDDHWTIERNPALAQLHPVGRFFTQRGTVAAAESGLGSLIYRPLPTLSFAVDNALGGLVTWRLRLENYLLHAAAGVAAFFIFSALGASGPGAALGVGLFLFHPAQVETVVWITQRSNLMCTLFSLLAFLAYTKNRWMAAAAAFAAALLCKETAVMFVFLLPILDLALRGHRRLRLWAAAAGLAAAYFLLRWAVVGPPVQRELRGTFFENLLVGAASGYEYVKILLAPVNLRVSHRDYVTEPWTSPWTWAGVFLAGLGIWFCLKLWRRNRPAAFFLAWIPATLAPVLGLFPIDAFVGERFLYTPLAGAAGLGALLWDRLPPRRRGLLWAVPAVWAGLSFAQTGVWRSELSLWSHAVARDPQNAFAHLCRAQSLADIGRRGESEGGYRRALELGLTRPQAAAALTNLARLRLESGDPQGALDWAEKAVKAGPREPAALLVRVQALGILGRREEGLAALAALEAAAPPPEQWRELRRRVEAISRASGTP